MACTVQLQASPLHCPISAQIRSIRANHGQEFWYCLDYFIKALSELFNSVST